MVLGKRLRGVLGKRLRGVLGKRLRGVPGQRLAGRVGFAVALGLLVGLVVSVRADSQRESLLLRGDFPAFYAAGAIVLDGRSASIYDPKLQHDYQHKHWPSLGDTYYAFAYPPWVACLFAPFAFLPAITAKVIWTALLALALWGAGAVLPLALPKTQRFLLALCTLPVFFGVLAGQNVALSMLLYALIAVYASKPETAARSAKAGLALGLWLFKPHFALTAFFFLAVGGRFRVLAWSSLPLAAFCLLATVLVGLHWPALWTEALSEFSPRDYHANAGQMVSFLGAAHSLAQRFGGDALLKGTALVACTAVVLMTGRRFFEVRSAPDDRLRWQRAAALLGPTIVLISPHTLFYDAGLCVISLALLPAANRPGALRRQAVPIGAGIAILAVLRYFRVYFPFDPLTLAVAACYCWICWTTQFFPQPGRSSPLRN